MWDKTYRHYPDRVTVKAPTEAIAWEELKLKQDKDPSLRGKTFSISLVAADGNGDTLYTFQR